jgi:hypothetical protein
MHGLEQGWTHCHDKQQHAKAKSTENLSQQATHHQLQQQPQ